MRFKKFMENKSKAPKQAKLPKIGGPSSPFLGISPRGPEWDMPDLDSIQDRNPLGGFKSFGQAATAWTKGETSKLKSLQRFSLSVRSILSMPEEYGVDEDDIDNTNLMIYGIERDHIYKGATFIAIGSLFTNEEYTYAKQQGIIIEPSKMGKVDTKNGNIIIDINVAVLKEILAKEMSKANLLTKFAQQGDQLAQGMNTASGTQLGQQQQF